MENITKKLLLSYAPAISTIMLMISYVPQIYTTITTQNVQGQSVMFWILLTIACFGFFLQQVGMVRYEGLKKYSGLIAQGVNFVCAIIMLVLVLVFK